MLDAIIDFGHKILGSKVIKMIISVVMQMFPIALTNKPSLKEGCPMNYIMTVLCNYQVYNGKNKMYILRSNRIRIKM